jgi:hypothetical protein
MHDDFIRDHIARLAAGDQQVDRLLMDGAAEQCWPGGAADRTEPVARLWLRLWRPARTAAILPVCSCAAGRCSVCN